MRCSEARAPRTPTPLLASSPLSIVPSGPCVRLDFLSLIMIRQSALLNSAGVQAATLFVHGEVDYRVPTDGSIQLYSSLKKQGIPTKLIIYEGMALAIRGHLNEVHRMMPSSAGGRPT